MSAKESSTEHQGQSSAVELAGKGRDERGRFPQIWTIEKAVKESRKFSSRKEFRCECSSAYQLLVKKGKLGLLCFDKGKKHRLSDWDVFCAAKKSRSIGEFSRLYPSEFSAFHKRKHISRDITSHMPRSITAKRWTSSAIRQSASQYKTKKCFRTGNPKAYDAAIRTGEIKNITFDESTGYGDYDVFYIWETKIDGIPIIKIGVTSFRLRMQRIRQVERSSGLKSIRCTMIETKLATSIEVALKRVLKSANLTGFNGATEFMLVSQTQLDKIKGALKWISKEHQNGEKQELEKLLALQLGQSLV